MDTAVKAAIEKLATSKAIAGATKDLEPGEYRVKALIDVDAIVTKGEDYTQTFWNALPLLGMLLRSMNSAGLILGKGQVKRMIKDVLENGLTSEELLQEKELGNWVKELTKAMQDSCTKPASGKTTAVSSIKIINAVHDFTPVPVKEETVTA
ncbi:MAG: hypothetical protein JRC86_00535 [Deltaproteobacteria bacterium]|nr:hypothetical protein [Deltaproteobacteria bacterium]